MKVSGLEGQACLSSITWKEVHFGLLLLSFGSHLALLSGLDDLGCWHLSFLGWLRCIPLHLALVGVAIEMSVAKMLKLHLSFVNVSVAVVAGADRLFPLPCFGYC